MGQAEIGDFSRDDGGGRPDEEAAAVAGDGRGAAATVVDAGGARFPDAAGTLELAVTQVDYTVEEGGDGEYPVVHVFGRTPDGEPEHVRVLGVEPYFYVPTARLDVAPVEEYDAVLDARESGPDGEPFRSIRGDRLTKIVARTPRDVGRIREDFGESYEADILFPNRFLIDYGIESGLRVEERRLDDGALQVAPEHFEPAEVDADLRVLMADIEVDDRRGFPEDGEEPIVCLSSHDSYENEYVAWLYNAPDGDVPPPEAVADHDLLDDGASVEVRAFDSEEAMLDAFLEYVDELDVDVMSGWNFEDFDAPYLLDRLEVLGMDPNRLSRVNEVWRSSGDWGGPTVKGLVVFDLLYAYQRTQFSELDSYRLDDVAAMELDAGKERYPGDIGDLWEEDPERLLEYNLRDVELCVGIDEKQAVVEFWNEVRKFVGCKLEDATTPGDAVDMYVLHKAYGKFALPTKGQQEGEEFEGGAVFDPISGVKEMVSVLDLRSLYPMAMVTMNASPETKVGEDYDGETYVAPNGQRFRKEPDGIMREMVDELLEEREEKKALRDEHDPGSEAYERYDRQQAAVKVIMNSLYGVSGWERFRLYDKENAAAVTATGREVIEFTEQAANELDKDVIYGDSVTGDRPVVVRDPDGRLRILPIGDLFGYAEVRSGSELRITVDGGQVASVEPPKERGVLPGWEALSVDDDGEPEWQPIQQIIRHETDKPVVKLQHKFGESTTTRDHSYVVEEGGRLREATPDDVDVPLRIPTIPDVDGIDAIDVYEVLRGYERDYEDGRGTGGTTVKTKRIHANENWVWFGHGHHDQFDSTVRVKRFIETGTEACRALIRLLAAYVSEGSSSTIETTESKFGASIAESSPEWLRQLRKDYHRLFENTTASITTSDRKTERTVNYDTEQGNTPVTYNDETKKLQMMNELASVLFREFAGQTSRGKRIPWFVFHLPREEQDLFLDTLVEGDGSRESPRYTEEYARRNFDFETTSRELAGGLSMLLVQRGKKHSLKYRDAKDTYTIRTCDSYRGGRDPVVTEVGHDGYVYDLDVAENGNFVDAVGGIVLHNTDSVMLELGDVSKEEAIEGSFEIEAHINSRYDEFAREELNAAEHRFEIEFEKLYRRFFQAGRKKRYAGHIIWKEGKDVDDIDITGFEYKRSDIAPITKEVQQRVLETIVTSEGDVGELREELTAYLHGVIEEFEAGNVDPDEVGIPGGIGKRLGNYDTDTAQVRGAKYANLLLGTNFDRGSKPKRLYLKRVDPTFFDRFKEEHPELFPNGDGMDGGGDLDPEARRKRELFNEFRTNQDVICFEYADQIPEEFEIDWDRMLEKTLKGPIARVIEAIDLSWDEVRSGQEQTGLESFM